MRKKKKLSSPEGAGRASERFDTTAEGNKQDPIEMEIRAEAVEDREGIQGQDILQEGRGTVDNIFL